MSEDILSLHERNEIITLLIDLATARRHITDLKDARAIWTLSWMPHRAPGQAVGLVRYQKLDRQMYIHRAIELTGQLREFYDYPSDDYDTADS